MYHLLQCHRSFPICVFSLCSTFFFWSHILEMLAVRRYCLNVKVCSLLSKGVTWKARHAYVLSWMMYNRNYRLLYLRTKYWTAEEWQSLFSLYFVTHFFSFYWSPCFILMAGKHSISSSWLLINWMDGCGVGMTTTVLQQRLFWPFLLRAYLLKMCLSTLVNK